MTYVLCALCYMCYVKYYYGPEGKILWAGRQFNTGRKAICYGPEGDYVTGRKAMLCGPKGPGRKAYVGKSYTGELTKHLCLLVVFMFFRY